MVIDKVFETLKEYDRTLTKKQFAEESKLFVCDETQTQRAKFRRTIEVLHRTKTISRAVSRKRIYKHQLPKQSEVSRYGYGSY